MNLVSPKVYLIAATRPTSHHPYTNPDEDGLSMYLRDVGGEGWTTDAGSWGEALVEAAGRLCYRSWGPGLNPNVTKVHTGNRAYVGNILRSRHTSVLEHVNVTFIFRHVSRVFTHELVRHRAGCAYSQESMRYVRLSGEVPMVMTGALEQEMDGVLPDSIGFAADRMMDTLGDLLATIVRRFHLDDPNTKFGVKKAVTSAMRRFVGMGVATDIMWTANLRTCRHVLEMRTDVAAEAEIRDVFNTVGHILSNRYPAIFQDFVRLPDGQWTTQARANALAALQDGYNCEPLPQESCVLVPRAWVEEWADRMKGNP